MVRNVFVQFGCSCRCEMRIKQGEREGRDCLLMTSKGWHAHQAPLESERDFLTEPTLRFVRCVPG